MKIKVKFRGTDYIVDLFTCFDGTINGLKVYPDEVEEVIIGD